ncbi:MAG: MurR/RpiR family transcriptional regulator [Bacillus sp. (in: firmicutes)]
MKLEELINIHYDQLHENDFHILKYILNHPNDCYNLGINDLAKKCNVSRSSILRLAQKLNFSGYSEFRVYLKWEYQEKNEPKSTNNYPELFKREVDATFKNLNMENMKQSCTLIHRSRKVFVYGTGSAQLNVAFELQRSFVSLHKLMVIIHDKKEFETMLPIMNTEDCIIIISLSGDTPTLKPKVQKLIAKGIPIISITNLKNNQLAQMTKYNLYATSSEINLDNGVNYYSLATFYLVCEMLMYQYIDYLEDENKG